MSCLEKLPNELFDRILRNLDGVSLNRCRIINKHWKDFTDNNECLWREICQKEFKHASKIARKKSGTDMTWQNIYKNLKKWQNISSSDKSLRKFYNFTMHDKCHALGVDYSILALREAKGIILYDMNTLKYVPVAVPEKSCIKISHTELVTVIQIKQGLLLQRTVKEKHFDTEKFFKADNFVLEENEVYFYNDRKVYRIDLKAEKLVADLIMSSEYDIKEFSFSEGTIHLFTDCGKIVNIYNKKVTETSINIPEDWIKSIKHICPLDDTNYVCYSRNLFKVKMDSYMHLYLNFPPITALFFYGDVILIGTKAGEILLYRMSSQKMADKPVFEKLAVLPENKFALTLDVYERRTGPLIVASTFLEVFILHVQFFEDNDKPRKGEFGNKVNMYKRLLKLRDRLRNVQSEIPSCV